MSLISSLTVSNGLTPPTNFVFTPKSFDKGVVTLRNLGTTLLEERKITYSARETPQAYIGDVRIALPIVVTDVINGVSVPRVDRVEGGSVNLRFTRKSTVDDRKAVRKMLIAAIDSAIGLMFDNGGHPYGG